MPEWSFFNYAELSGKNKIYEWLSSLPAADQARIDDRLLQMVATAVWPEKWASKYRCSGTLYEFRIKGTVQYRPLGNYDGRRRYLILTGAIEKGDRIPSTDVNTALDRQKRVQGNRKHVVAHQFESEDALEEDE